MAYIGQVIKFYRKMKGLSQEKVAEGVCSREYLGQIERNQCYPTLDIVDCISNKLGFDCYGLYSQISRHNDLETHEKIKKINEYLNVTKLNELPIILSEYNKDKAFESGEPFQVLMYANALYTSNIINDYEKSIVFAVRGLKENYEEISFVMKQTCSLTNVELALVQHLAVNYYRIGEIEKSSKWLLFLKNYLMHLLKTDKYTVNLNYHFELNLMGSVAYNIFMFKIYSDNNEMSKFINNIIALLNNYRCDSFLPELLLAKIELNKASGIIPNDNEYKTAIYLGEYLYGKEQFEKIQQAIINN